MSPQTALTAASAAADEAGERADVERLVLDVVSGKRKGLDRRIDGALVDGKITQSMAGASMLSLSLIDSDLELLTSGIFDTRIDTELDEIPFRLVTVNLGDDTLDLAFEHRVIAWLRQHDQPRKFSRGSFTRAEAAYALVREVKAGPIRFVSPDLHKRQPIKSSRERESQSSKDDRRAGGVPDDSKVKIKGRRVTKSQVREINHALDVAASLNAGPKATKALVVAGIGESGFRPIMNAAGSGYGGVFQGDVTAKYRYFAKTDTEGQAHYFLRGGKGFQGGGAIALARAHATWSAGQIATTVEASGESGGFYDRYGKEAEAIIEAYSGGGASFGAGGQYWSRYEFARGQAGKREDSWEALGRWAEEVRWRRFVAGQRTVYFASDDQLMRSRPRYVIDRQTSGLLSVNFEIEVGKRHITRKGRREPKPSTATLKVRLARWAAPPGSVIELADHGPADGRWLVDQIERGVYDAEGTVTLRQAQKALPEPRSEQVSRSDAGGGGKGRAGRVYDEAVRIHRRNLAYGPGGHGQRWAEARKATNLDCSSSTSLALHAGGMMPSSVKGPQVSDYFTTWGKAGEGKELTVWVKRGAGANGHVWIEFHNRSAKRFDTSPYGSGGRGPHMRYTDRGKSGFIPRHWPGS